ncbi:FAD-dependent oxidoreductase, partial [Streptomyces rubellomurinus subsp. indigoferus]
MDAVVVGAGVVGAACAYYAARAGPAVAVVDRGPVSGGPTRAGAEHLLVPDNEPGPELDLALLITLPWRDLHDQHAAEAEYEPQDGRVVAPTQA